jgi:hypothetical protein
MIMKRMFYLFFVFLPILFSCTDETASDAAPSPGVSTKVGFSLSAAKMQGMADTKSTDPTTIDDKKIDNLWVLQFQGGVRKKISYFSSVNADSFNADLKAGANSNIYFVANVGLNAFSNLPADETAFKNIAKSLSGEADVFYTPSSGKKLIPMLGSVTLDVPETGAVANQAVTLTRMLSRVDINYSVSIPYFTISKIRICNVPNKVQYCRPDAGSLFPATPTATDMQNYDYTGSLSSTGTLTFYVPENQRGTGSNTAATDPRLKNGVDYATYIEIVGSAKTLDGGVDEVSYRIYPGADNVNDYNIVRNAYYNVTASIKGVSDNDARLKIAYHQPSSSNCYMVRPGGTVFIPVKRANESSELGTQLADVTSSAWTADVLWQTASGLVTVTNADAYRANGTFRVSAGASTGNAVVVVRNGGNIIWSWHVWVTDYDPSATNQSFNNYTWMDRNLGATTNTPGATTTLGLYYQWGRKDPEIGPVSSASGTTTAQPVFNSLGGAYTWPNAVTNDPGAGNNLKNSVQHPSTHYFAGPYFNDWYTNNSIYANNTLWNTAKTVYDPCPVGWKVPPGDLTGAWAPLTDATFPYTAANLGRTITSCGAYYPIAGFRNGNNIVNVGSYGACWSSTYKPSGTSYHLHIGDNTGGMYSSSSSVRSYSFSVRCIKE